MFDNPFTFLIPPYYFSFILHAPISVGWGGGQRAPEEDAAAGERPRSDSGEADERQPEAGGEGESPAECEYWRRLW